MNDSAPREDADFRPGAKVRLKSNPDRVGVLSGETVVHKGMVRWQVHFHDTTDYVAQLALEVIKPEGDSPFVRLRNHTFSAARELRIALTHQRLTGKLADLIYSLNTTNTDFYAYQFKPVLSFLDSPSKGLLIADEVGLGKTIEAGLIWTELRTRAEAKRLLVVCPAMLAPKWRRELRDRFGISADILDARGLLEVLQEVTTGQRTEFAAVCSVQGLRPPSGWRDEEPIRLGPPGKLAQFLAKHDAEDGSSLFDLVVVDEAHYLRNPETQTSQLGRLLRPVADGLLLLSATPIQLKSTDLFELLNLIDVDSFPYDWSFDQALTENAPLIRLRDRLLNTAITREELLEDVRAAQTARSLGESEQLEHLIKNPPTDEQLQQVSARLELANVLDRINPLAKVVSRTRKRDVQERRVLRRVEALRGQLSPIERTFYDEITARVRDYCASSELPEGFVLTVPQRQMCSSMPAACRAWQRRASVEELREFAYESQGSEDVEGEESRPLIAQLISIARSVGNFETLRANDTKFATLWSYLRRYWSGNPDEKVVLFSYFRETLRYLQERLAEEGVKSITLMGGDDKEAALESFREGSEARILLSSEVASEGVDLQFCGLVVNYDLPWNPMKIEQRIGRIDRIGQRAESILVWNVLCEDTIDDRIYTRLFERLNIFESALGGTEAVLGEQVREMSAKLFSHQLSAEDEVEVIRQTAVAIETRLRVEDELEKEASQLLAHGDYLQNKINAARQMSRYVTDEDVYWYTRDFLEQRYPGCQFIGRPGSDLLFDIELSGDARGDLEDTLRAQRRLGETGLAGPASGRRACIFKNRLERPPRGVEVISQYHPLVSFVGQRRQEEPQWRQAAVSAASVDRLDVPGISPGRYVFAVQRWSVQGLRQWERVAFSARSVEEQGAFLATDDTERLINVAARKAEDWLTSRVDLQGIDVETLVLECIELMDEKFQAFVDAMARENADYVNYQLAVVERQRDREIRRYADRIEQLRLAGKTRTIPLEEGRRRKIERRLAERRTELERRSKLVNDHRLAIVGAIEVR